MADARISGHRTGCGGDGQGIARIRIVSIGVAITFSTCRQAHYDCGSDPGREVSSAD